SLLAPSLSTVRETAHQVICRSNVRQFGLGTSMYAEQNAERVPRALCVTGNANSDRSWDTLFLRFGDEAEHNGHSGEWDSLGLLFSAEFLPAPKLFYCPSHRGRNPFAAYSDQWAGAWGAIVGNYQFRGRAPDSSNPSFRLGTDMLS